MPLTPAPAVLARIRRSVARPDLEQLYEIQNRLDKTVARVGKIKVGGWEAGRLGRGGGLVQQYTAAADGSICGTESRAGWLGKV